MPRSGFKTSYNVREQGGSKCNKQCANTLFNINAQQFAAPERKKVAPPEQNVIYSHISNVFGIVLNGDTFNIAVF
jgi:hypothetical protein